MPDSAAAGNGKTALVVGASRTIGLALAAELMRRGWDVSRQGSVSLNTRGGHEVYRASKSALNQLMRSYAARNADDPRTLLLLHPGWVQTELGGPGAQLTVEESAHGVADVLERHAGDGGLQFLDYRDQVVPW
jgi:NAD(P)-dependent dehydrogenase (short-subunit alcohol dehydrogenase family)